jgi:hypothetical protein
LGAQRAVEQELAPDEAPELKMLNGVPGFIKVRLAAEARCSADLR